MTMEKTVITGAAVCCLSGCASLFDSTNSFQDPSTEVSVVSQLVQGDTGRPGHRLPCCRPDARRKDYGGEYYEVRAGQLVRVFRCLR